MPSRIFMLWYSEHTLRGRYLFLSRTNNMHTMWGRYLYKSNRTVELHNMPS